MNDAENFERFLLWSGAVPTPEVGDRFTLKESHNTKMEIVKVESDCAIYKYVGMPSDIQYLHIVTCLELAAMWEPS